MRLRAFGICVALLAHATPAWLHAATFAFTDTDAFAPGAFRAYGILTADDNGDGTFTATSGSGFFNADPIVLIPGSGISPSGAFSFNNLLYPAGNPLLDVNGLLFRDTITSAELNIWGNGPFPQIKYSTYLGFAGPNYPLQNETSDFELTQVFPEPATWSLLGMGLGLFATLAAKRSGVKRRS